MREIGSVADYLDVGAILEGKVIHIAPLRDAHFGETGAKRESTPPNLRHRWGGGDTRETGAMRESPVPNLRDNLTLFCSFVTYFSLLSTQIFAKSTYLPRYYM